MTRTLVSCKKDSNDFRLRVSSLKMCSDALSKGPAPSRCLVKVQGMNWSGNCFVSENKWEKKVIMCFGNGAICDFFFHLKTKFGPWPLLQ